MKYTYYDSPVGRLLVAGDAQGLRLIDFLNGKKSLQSAPEWHADPEFFAEVNEQLGAYFAGTLQQFTVRLAPRGTPFQRKVWKALQGIPYGQTIAYGQLAQAIEQPTASRAVGSATGANPLSIVVPCHRVIGANGALTGFGGGIDNKQWLLNHEAVLSSR